MPLLMALITVAQIAVPVGATMLSKTSVFSPGQVTVTFSVVPVLFVAWLWLTWMLLPREPVYFAVY
jgi:hypothetical protein